MGLPDIISGPILRRTEPDHVWLWIAASRPYEIRAELYEAVRTDASREFEYRLLSDASTSRRLELGERYYAYLIRIDPKGRPFPVNALLAYNLFFAESGEETDLGRLGLLDPQSPDTLVYGSLRYPTFTIDLREHPKALFGSCRKPHGEGRDALADADRALERDDGSPSSRPGALFLTGDQIYADDVADPLVPMLQERGRLLFGQAEESLEAVEPRLGAEPFQSSFDRIGGRGYAARYFAKFSSSHASNHLIRLREYAVMYALSWGPQLWNDEILLSGNEAYSRAVTEGWFHSMFPDSDCYRRKRAKERKRQRKRYLKQWKRLQAFRSTLPRVRRLLANVPTYMIFDDHDVTDDWNLSREWIDNVRHAPLGRRAVANALSAYWIFQAWGNDPDSFDDSFVSCIRNRLTAPSEPQSEGYSQWEDTLWDYADWHFVAPTQPAALFLDTRTMREFDSEPEPVRIGFSFRELPRSARLVKDDAWHSISEKLQQAGWERGDPLTVVSPAPVYGIGLIETFLHRCVYPLRALGLPVHRSLDFEAWKYNARGFHAFHRWLFDLAPSACAILSGDVHSASAVDADVRMSGGRRLRLRQFTSSPMHNANFTGIWGWLLRRAIALNAFKRKRRSLHRYCGSDYRLLYGSDASKCPADALWSETTRYLPLASGNVIETANNIGMLQWSESTPQGTLLTGALPPYAEDPFVAANLVSGNRFWYNL